MLNVNVFLMNVVFFLYLTIKNTQQQHNESCAVVVLYKCIVIHKFKVNFLNFYCG